MSQPNPETFPLSESPRREPADPTNPQSECVPPDGDGGREACEQLLLDHLPMVKRLVATLARQHRMSAQDAEDVASLVYVKLVGDDYAVLRSFCGRSALKTFLAVVVERVYLDYRTAQWGKYRPSVRARKSGELAILLERLIVRDGHTFDEAFTVLETAHGGSLQRETLERVSCGFRPRLRPRFVSEDEMREAPQAKSTADVNVVHAEDCRVVARAAETLTGALGRLTPRDRLIVTLRFGDGMTVAAIARTLTMEQKSLYPRINRLVSGLRKELESAGVRAADVLHALDRNVSDEGGTSRIE